MQSLSIKIKELRKKRYFKLLDCLAPSLQTLKIKFWMLYIDKKCMKDFSEWISKCKSLQVLELVYHHCKFGPNSNNYFENIFKELKCLEKLDLDVGGSRI